LRARDAPRRTEQPARRSGCRHRPGATLGTRRVRRPPTRPDSCHPDTGRSAKTASFVRLRRRALGCIRQTRPLRVLAPAILRPCRNSAVSRPRLSPQGAPSAALQDQNTPSACTQGRPRNGSKPKSRLKVECHWPPDHVRCARRCRSQIHAGVRALAAPIRMRCNDLHPFVALYSHLRANPVNYEGSSDNRDDGTVP
jgi:hypothetical protein